MSWIIKVPKPCVKIAWNSTRTSNVLLKARGAMCQCTVQCFLAMPEDSQQEWGLDQKEFVFFLIFIAAKVNARVFILPVNITHLFACFKTIINLLIKTENKIIKHLCIVSTCRYETCAAFLQSLWLNSCSTPSVACILLPWVSPAVNHYCTFAVYIPRRVFKIVAIYHEKFLNVFFISLKMF